MLIFVVISSCLISAIQGRIQVGKVEAQSIRLHLNGGPLDEGFNGESVWSCSRVNSNESEKEESHGWGREELVFVQQEPTHYKHKVVIKGLHKHQKNTTVYVVPANNTHEIDVQTEGASGDIHKPSFFFLKDHPLNSPHEGSPNSNFS